MWRDNRRRDAFRTEMNSQAPSCYYHIMVGIILEQDRFDVLSKQFQMNRSYYVKNMSERGKLFD